MAIRKKLTPERLIALHTQDKLSLTEIGKRYGVSRQRIHQLKKEYEEKHGKIRRRKPIEMYKLKMYLDKGCTIEEIAEKEQVKAHHVNRDIQKYREIYKHNKMIKLNKKKIEEKISKEVLRQLYEQELLTDREISERYGFSASSIANLRKKYGIQAIYKKSLRRLEKELTRELLEKAIGQGKTLEWIASKQGCSVASLIELKKKYKIKK